MNVAIWRKVFQADETASAITLTKGACLHVQEQLGGQCESETGKKGDRELRRDLIKYDCIGHCKILAFIPCEIVSHWMILSGGEP